MKITKLRLKYPGQFGSGPGSIADTIGDEHVVEHITTGDFAGYYCVYRSSSPSETTLIPPSNVASVSGVQEEAVPTMTSTDIVTQPAKRAKRTP